MQKVTVYDICLRTGLSTATVSRVLNQSGPVSQSARDKVMLAAQDLGYSPSFAARSLAKQRSDLIGAIFPRMAPGFFSDILGGLDDGVREAGLHLLTSFSHGIADQKVLAERFVSQRLVGVLVLMNLHLEESFIEYLHKQGLPVVTMDRQSPAVSSVSIDNFDGVRQVMEHIKQQGHGRLAIIMGPLDAHDSLERRDASLQLAKDYGIEIAQQWQLMGGFSERGGYTVVKKLLTESDSPPPAIFAFNDLMALGGIRALREAGVRVPEDTCVVGFDDVEMAELFELTTVHVPMAQMGMAAAKIALAHLNGESQTLQRVIKPTLRVRGT